MNPYIELPKVPLIFRRHDFLVEIARGKRVLHLGCVDAGLLEERFNRGELLHQRLAMVTAELWRGFDIEEAGIDFLRAKGFDKLIVGDLSYIDQFAELQQAEFDLILASEVVEHLQNPGLFFQAIQALMKPGHTHWSSRCPMRSASAPY
ncbi:MAG: methyltransferase domain-containing protein [Caldilineaceae bacterium]